MSVPISSLSHWSKDTSLEEIFNKNFSAGEKLHALKAISGLTINCEIPDYELRHSLVIIANHVDASPDASLFIFQDEGEKEAVTLKIRSVRQQADGTPLFDVEYNVANRKNPMAGAEALSKLMRASSGVYQMKASLDEQRLLREELERNAKKGTYTLSKPSMKAMKSSYLVQIERPADNEDPIKFKKPERQCLVCGKASSKSCQQCKSAHYCSKECQVHHWVKGGHKLVCTTAEEVRAEPLDASSSSIVFSIVAPNDIAHPMARMNIATNISNVDGRMHAAPNPHRCPVNVHGDKQFLIKVQVPLVQGTGQMLMIYDEKRSFQRMVYAVEPAYRVLENTVRRNPKYHQGVKLYFKAKREATNLRVFIDSLPEQMQRW